MVYCAEIELRYRNLGGEDEFRTFYVSGLNRAMRDRAIETLAQDECAEVWAERYYTEQRHKEA